VRRLEIEERIRSSEWAANGERKAKKEKKRKQKKSNEREK